MEGIALTVRMTRSAMLENLNQDFVRTLRAGGLSESSVVGRHVFRNALVPIVSLAGLRIGQIVGYALVVETIFGWPGLGQVLVNAVLRRDYPVAQFFSLVLGDHRVVGQLAGRRGLHGGQPPAEEGLTVTASAARSTETASAPAPPGRPLLSVRGLRTTVTTGGETFDVVRDLSLDIYPNEIMCLVGESGCGKSITALSIMRLLPTPPVRVREGEILFKGRDLLRLKNRRMRRLRSDSISMIFRTPSPHSIRCSRWGT